MSVYKYKAFKSGSKVSRLIIFLHGYNSCIEDVEPFAEMLLQHLDNTLVVMPEADTQSERNPLKNSGMLLLTLTLTANGANRRRQQTKLWRFIIAPAPASARRQKR